MGGPALTRTIADYALAYAGKGWHVFPCWWIEDGACACRDVSCKSPGKHPIGQLVPRGHIDASIAPQRISSWWRQFPKANIAVYLSASNLCAIDIDPRNGGNYTMEQIEATHGPVRSDVLAYTGGGGEHRVFAAPNDLSGLPGKLGPGIDVKLNGYIVVEPSVHISGRAYSWEAESDPLADATPSPLPDWLRGFVAPATTVSTAAQVVAPATVRDLRSALASLRSDDRDTWVALGHALKPLGDVGRGLWLEWSQTSDKYDARDSAEKWDSFQTSHTGYQAVFAKAQASGWVNPVSGAVAVVAGPVVEPGESLLLDYDALTAAAGQLTWAVKRVLPQQSVGVMFGASGTFKSFIALDGCLHIAHGMQWMGQRTKRGPVVYLAAEGSVGIARRVTAWHNARRLNPRDADIRFCIRPLSLLTQAALLRQEIESLQVQPVLIVIDTMSQTFVGEENASSEVAEYLRAIRIELAHAFGACVLVIHHSGHAATERPRGSSAIRANSDFLIGVFRDEKDMLATVEVVHQKDGELLGASSFGLSSISLGTDGDGDVVTSLVAKHLDCAADVLESASRSRSSGLAMLIQAIDTGRPEKTVRDAFYALMTDKAPDARRQAYYRALKQAQQSGVITVNGDWVEVVTTKTGDEA